MLIDFRVPGGRPLESSWALTQPERWYFESRGSHEGPGVLVQGLPGGSWDGFFENVVQLEVDLGGMLVYF